jgi:hypothetical protein
MKINSLAEFTEHARKRFERLALAYDGDDAFPAPLPPGNSLYDLIVESFWASLSRDEKRPCQFKIAYSPQLSEKNVTIPFEARGLERDNLRRLAPVALAAQAEVAVSLIGEELKIIGLCKELYGPKGLDQQRFMPVVIDVRSPGHLAI